MNRAIQLEAVIKRFGGQTVLDQLDLTVPSGSVFALLGENGAGKSTTVRILMGLLSSDAGAVRVLELDPARQSLEVRRQVGYVPERPTLYEWMTVEQIGWFTSGFYSPEFLNRYRRQTAGFGLPAGRRIKELSKGMRAKVSLALALAKDPALLVLDEPTSGLDTLVRREFLESMLDRALDGKTVFLSSHQIGEVERVADYVAILHRGRLLVVDRLEKLKAETTEVTLSFSEPQFSPPQISGALLSQRGRARQWQALVRGADRAALEHLREVPGVVDVQLRTANLEEIYVALLSQDEAAACTDGEVEPACRERPFQPESPQMESPEQWD